MADCYGIGINWFVEGVSMCLQGVMVSRSLAWLFVDCCRLLGLIAAYWPGLLLLLNAAKEQHKDICNILQGASITLHIILLGVDGTIYNTYTLKPFKELGLDSQRVKKLASKLHVHSVNFAAKLVHTRRALSSTVINSHQEPVSGQACNPLDPH